MPSVMSLRSALFLIQLDGDLTMLAKCTVWSNTAWFGQTQRVCFSSGSGAGADRGCLKFRSKFIAMDTVCTRIVQMDPFPKSGC